ncbi:helicase HerA-like domain-containing protein [uncultured Thiodictyon sp.]|uniref:helicase HerA-like domain-containing protein n=3 Tax=uncultured Thiodictyon sp. TaxID=1846217 RepID=UPI0025F15B46|nr:helicase HerA-like domain-containing protein [uncultured Thiodictyon sp.]
MIDSVLVGTGQAPVSIGLRMANRHGLIAGATGTGKTVTLQRLAEQFSRAGVPVFLADVKGDLAGISQAGGDNPAVAQRVAQLGLEQSEGFRYAANPVMFWDIQGQQGHPVRTTISELGPLLLGRLLGLNEVQEGVLNIVFQLADENGWLLLDLKDLRSLLTHAADAAETLQTRYGNVSKASVGAILRRLLALEQQGAQALFGEPALNLADLMQTDEQGHGYINILAADRLVQTPAVYSTFLLWLLAELFETLPEVGDVDRPKLVFFFDEAHLLFNDAPKVLLNKIEQVVRLIRSKGVGVYFVTQSPLDVPETVLGQLGNRVQHALRAFTPKDQQAVRAAAQTFRPNPDLDTQAAITALGVGEALVSTLDGQGVPGIVQRVTVAPPGSRLGPVTAAERQAVMDRSLVKGVYDVGIDRVSAYEQLAQRATEVAGAAPGGGGWREVLGGALGSGGRSRGRQTTLEAFATSAARSLGSQIGRQLVRGVMGSLFGTKTGGKG